jgi:hypothetical protein
MTSAYELLSSPSAPSTEIARHLIEREHGPILSCPALWRLLGYRTADAFRKAVQRKTVPVETFSIPHRRGRFARTADVVRWLDTVTAVPVVDSSDRKEVLSTG